MSDVRSSGDPKETARVVLRKEQGGEPLAIELVGDRDLVDPIAELWFAAGLRKGHPQLALADVRARLRPVHRPIAGRAGRICTGFSLETELPHGDVTRRIFARETLEHVAARASRSLLEQGMLQKGELYFYELEVADDGIFVGPLVTGAGEPPIPDVAPIGPLLADSRAVESGTGGEGERDDFPVFYAEAALRKAERVSRKGGCESPPIETGGLLIGRLGWCPETRTLYAVVDDVLEATHSEGTTFTLTYSADSWARIQTIMRARQSRPQTRSQRVLGQAHGHSFLPVHAANEAQGSCDDCALRAHCELSTAFLSAEDRQWCRAVLSGEPWQLSHVFGLTARREPVDTFYGQHAGMLVKRSYRVLEAAVATRTKERAPHGADMNQIEAREGAR